MRMINGMLYIAAGLLFLTWILVQKKEEKALSGFTRYLKHHIHIPVILLIVNSLSFGMTFFERDHSLYIEKEDYGGSVRQEDFLLTKGEETEQVTLDVRPRQFTEKERKQKMEEAFVYLEDHMKGENDSLLKVTSDLDFSIDYAKYPFDVEFQPQHYALIDGMGNLKNKEEELLAAGYDKEQMRSGIETGITVLLWYGDACEKKSYEVLVFPKEESATQQAFSKVKTYIKNQEEEAAYQEGFALSSNLDGVEITRLEDKGVTPFRVILFGILLIGLLFFREQENARKEENLRREMLLKSYPWFVNELVLLLGAGMQVKNIFQLLITQYEKEESRKKEGAHEKKGFYNKKSFRNKKGIRKKEGSRKKKGIREKSDYRDVLIRELRTASHSLELGMSEQQVYYQLGRRLKLSCYMKLMTLLEQNVIRGSKGLTAAFEREELEALEERKNLARRYGEEAGTKLLGPMIVLLMVVICMIMVPAFLSFA